MIRDVRGLPTSAPDTASLESFEAALKALYGYRGDPLALIGETIDGWPDWSLPHTFRALVLLGLTERRFAAGAAASLATAEALLEAATPRERVLVRAARHMLEHRWEAACHDFERLLLDDPLDMLALQSAHNLDFFRGDLWNLRNRINRVLPCWPEDAEGYAHVLGMHAFGLEECNHYPEAERAAEASLALAPDNPWATHALAHVYEMQGRADDGVALLAGRAHLWAPDSGFAYHNWWHLALFHLDRGEDAQVLALYDRELADPEASFALNRLDATALLWRLKILGIDAGERPAPVAAWWRRQIDDGGAYYAFNDLHAAVALALAEDGEALARLEVRLQEAAPGDGDGRLTREIGLPLVRAFRQYQAGQWADCATALVTLRDAAQRFGGSHAQRDLLTLTLVVAAARARQPELARRYLNERRVMKPASGLGVRLAARLGLA